MAAKKRGKGIANTELEAKREMLASQIAAAEEARALLEQIIAHGPAELGDLTVDEVISLRVDHDELQLPKKHELRDYKKGLGKRLAKFEGAATELIAYIASNKKDVVKTANRLSKEKLIQLVKLQKQLDKLNA